MTDYGKVAVLMGGWSAEREVSLMSGHQVLNALKKVGVDAEAVDADKNVIDSLKAGKFDRVFNVLHGKGGEDGVIQSVLQLHNIPYTGTGVLGSALSMNKQKAKIICSSQGILTPKWFVVNSYRECEAAVESLSYPVVVKPVSEGSSVGVSVVMGNAQLLDAWKNASAFGSVMMEQFIDGVEVTAAIIGSTVMPLVSMSTTRQFYDYKAKYEDNNTQYLCPSALSDEQSSEIQVTALKAFKSLEVYGWGRVDFIVNNDDGVAYFIELNTIPGMTSHSLVPLAAAEYGWDFEKLCLEVLNSSFETYYEC